MKKSDEKSVTRAVEDLSSQFMREDVEASVVVIVTAGQEFNVGANVSDAKLVNLLSAVLLQMHADEEATVRQ